MMLNLKKAVLTLVWMVSSAQLALASATLSETTGWTTVSKPTTFTLVDAVDGTTTTFSEKLGVFTLKRRVEVVDASNTQVALITQTVRPFGNSTLRYSDVVDGVATIRFSTDSDNQIIDTNGTVIAVITSETDSTTGTTTVAVVDTATDENLATLTSTSDETTVDGQAPYTHLLSSQPVFDRISTYRTGEYVAIALAAAAVPATIFGVKLYRDYKAAQPLKEVASGTVGGEPAAAVTGESWFTRVSDTVKNAATTVSEHASKMKSSAMDAWNQLPSVRKAPAVVASTDSTVPAAPVSLDDDFSDSDDDGLTAAPVSSSSSSSSSLDPSAAAAGHPTASSVVRAGIMTQTATARASKGKR